jgi:hypothetical protein
MTVWRLGTMGLCATFVGGCSIFGSVDNPGPGPTADAATTADAAEDTAPEPCDVDGVWALSGEAVSYTCCSGSVDIQVDEVILDDDGAEARTLPFPTILAGEPTTCPDGTFDAEGSASGGLCTVGAQVTGSFTGADTWDGTVELTFVGCCPDLDPCLDQTFAVTGTRSAD